MIISRQFKIALLVSLFWHLFCILSFSILFLSPNFKIRQYYSVNFLGSIFQERASLARTPLKTTDTQEAVYYPQRKKREYFQQGPEISLPVERSGLNPESLIDIDGRERQKEFGASFIQEITVSAKREVIYKPVFPLYPDWPPRIPRGAKAVFRIAILPDGLVQQAINVLTCGNPEIDTALARYLKSWRFAPAAAEQAEWQTIEIKGLNDKTGI